jgi:hypothetical protein
MPFLNIDWVFAFGEPNRYPDQPLVLQRAFRAVAEDGRPQTALSLVLLQPNRERQEVFWFGVFVVSQGERVVFFLPYEATGFDFFDGKTKHPPGGYPVDHITLEVARHRWHFTGTDPKRHTGGPQIVPLSGGGYLWFGIATARLEFFPKLRQANLVGFPVPDSDADRRVELVKAVRDGARDLILSLNPRAYSMRPPWYVQFNFAIGPSGFDPPDHEIARFIVNPRLDPTGGCGLRVTTPASKFRLSLSSELDVLVACFPLPRDLLDRYAIVSWA